LEACRRQAELEANTPPSGATADPDTTLMGSYSQMRARFVIDSQLWNDDVVRWTLPAGDLPSAQLTFDYTNPIAAIERKDDANARVYADRVISDRQKVEAWLERNKVEEPRYGKRAHILASQVQALLLLHQGKTAEAVQELQKIAAEERAMPF